MADPNAKSGPKLGLVVLTAVLIAMLGFAAWGFVAMWRMSGDTSISVHGYIALAIAGLGTLVLGGGLMWLAFYSSRKGWDDIDR
jgi:hypothetical protein